MQRYASYKGGFGERVEKGAATLEECEDYIKKCGDPQQQQQHQQSARNEHWQAVLNHYVFPPSTRQ